MSFEMRSDVELLLTIVDNESDCVDRLTGKVVRLSRKGVAHLTGRAVQTISDYCSGKYNIPMDFWKRLFERTGDTRIWGLLLGDGDTVEVILGDVPPPTNPRAFFKAAVAESGAHHQKQAMIAELLSDGRIDELDRQTVQDYHDAYLRNRHLDAVLHHQIIDVYNRAVAQKEPA